MEENIKTIDSEKKENTGVSRNWLYQAFMASLSCPVRIAEKVKKAKSAVKGKGKRNNNKVVVEYMIERKSRATALIGGATAVPGTIPIIGTVGTIVTAMSSELVAVTKLEIELCLEIACCYGYDISSESRVWEIMSIMDSQGRKPTRGDEVLKRMIERAVKTGLIRVMRRISRRLGVRLFKRLAFKIIPWIGIPIGAGYNMISTREVGRAAQSYYCKRTKNKREGGDKNGYN